MSSWNSIQLNNKYLHVCKKCNKKRKKRDDMPREEIKDYGLDKYVHYVNEDGSRMCEVNKGD